MIEIMHQERLLAAIDEIDRRVPMVHSPWPWEEEDAECKWATGPLLLTPSWSS